MRRARARGARPARRSRSSRGPPSATVRAASAAPDAPLTPRETEILQLVAAGRTNREIADVLYISPATVKRHVTNILAKLELPMRAAAITWGIRAGLVAD